MRREGSGGTAGSSFVCFVALTLEKAALQRFLELVSSLSSPPSSTSSSSIVRSSTIQPSSFLLPLSCLSSATISFLPFPTLTSPLTSLLERSVEGGQGGWRDESREVRFDEENRASRWEMSEVLASPPQIVVHWKRKSNKALASVLGRVSMRSRKPRLTRSFLCPFNPDLQQRRKS